MIFFSWILDDTFIHARKRHKKSFRFIRTGSPIMVCDGELESPTSTVSKGSRLGF